MFQPQFTAVKADSLTRLSSIQTALNVKLTAKDEIKSVLAATATPTITSYECKNREIVVYGRCNYKLVVALSDGKISGMAYNADFNERLNDVDAPDNAQLFFDTVVVENGSSISENSINMQTLVEITPKFYQSNSVNALVGGEDIFVKTGEIVTASVSCNKTIPLEISSDLVASRPITRVINAESNITIDEYKLSEGVLTVKGDAVVNFVYMSEDEVTCDVLHFDVNEEIATDAVDENDFVLLRAKVKNSKIRIDLAEEGGNNLFTIDITIELCLICTNEQTTTVVTDAYSLTNLLNLTAQSVKSTLPVGRFLQDITIEQNIPLPADFDKFITATNMQLEITGATATDYAVLAEGVLSGALLYQGEEVKSTQISLPMSAEIKGDWIDEKMAVECYATLTNLSYKVSRNEIAVNAKAILTVIASREAVESVITEAALGESVAEDFGAIEVCIARKGEEIWDIAKQLHMKEEDILAVNPDLPTPLQTDAKIVIYHRL